MLNFWTETLHGGRRMKNWKVGNVYLKCSLSLLNLNHHILGLPRRRQWQPTPVLLPGKSHGRRSMVGCSPWGCTESDTTEVT